MNKIISITLLTIHTLFLSCSHGQQKIIEIEIKTPSTIDSISLNNLSISYNIALAGQNIDLKSIFHQKKKNIFQLEYSSLENGLYEIVINSTKYKQENSVGFIKNDNTSTRGIVKKILYVQKNDKETSSQSEQSWAGFSIEEIPYFKINSERKEWNCYIKQNLKTELLDSLSNQKIAFDIEWDNKGKVVNILFSNSFKNSNLKREVEKILYSSPAWIRPKVNNFFKDTYSLTFDNSKIYNCH